MNKIKIIIEAIIIFIIILLIIILFKSNKKIELFGNTYSISSKYIDLTNINITSFEELDTKLNNFKILNKVDLGNNKLYIDEYKKLEKNHPNIKFNGIKIYNIYGLNISSDTTYIDFSNIIIDNNLKDYLKLFPNLKYINLNNQNLNLQSEYDLVTTFPNISFDFTIPIDNIKVSTNSEKLNLNGINITKENLIKIIKMLPKLTYLDMGRSKLSNEELAEVRQIFPNIKIAWIIDFGIWHIKTDDIAFSVLITHYNYTRLTSEDLGFLKYCTDLQALDLGHQKITDINTITDNLPNLRVLILADNKITDITSLNKLKHLHYLELFMNKITDISPLKDNQELVDLNISYNPIKDYNVINYLPKLERLWAVSARLKEVDYKNITTNYPNIKLSRYGKGSTDSGWRTHKRYYSMIDMYRKRNYISEEFTKYDS